MDFPLEIKSVVRLLIYGYFRYWGGAIARLFPPLVTRLSSGMVRVWVAGKTV